MYSLEGHVFKEVLAGALARPPSRARSSLQPPGIGREVRLNAEGTRAIFLGLKQVPRLGHTRAIFYHSAQGFLEEDWTPELRASIEASAPVAALRNARVPEAYTGRVVVLPQRLAPARLPPGVGLLYLGKIPEKNVALERVRQMHLPSGGELNVTRLVQIYAHGFPEAEADLARRVFEMLENNPQRSDIVRLDIFAQPTKYASTFEGWHNAACVAIECFTQDLRRKVAAFDALNLDDGSWLWPRGIAADTSAVAAPGALGEADPERRRALRRARSGLQRVSASLARREGAAAGLQLEAGAFRYRALTLLRDCAHALREQTTRGAPPGDGNLPDVMLAPWAVAAAEARLEGQALPDWETFTGAFVPSSPEAGEEEAGGEAAGGEQAAGGGQEAGGARRMSDHSASSSDSSDSSESSSPRSAPSSPSSS